MATKIKGTVKWFSNKKGFGFITPSSDNAPTKDDIFVHQSNIVSNAEYRTLKDGFEVEFEAITDDNGKLKAQNVTSSDGSPCPGPDPKERRVRRKKGPKKGGESGDEAEGTTDDEAKPEVGAGDDKEKKAGGRNRRRRKNGKKSTEGAAAPAAAPATGGENKEAKEPKKTWYSDLEPTVQESMVSRSIKVDAGRAFVAIGDARIKLGTGGYLALAHKKGLLAEGKYTCDAKGKIVATWEHVLKYDADEWKPATADEEKESLVAEILLTDDAVKPTGADETTETLWGEGKKDPKDILESNGFLMRKVALNPSAGGGRRGRGRRNQGRRNNGDKAAPAKAE